MEAELRLIIGKYGMRAVHLGILKEMRETFQYMQTVFPDKNELVIPPVPHPTPTLEIINDCIPEHFMDVAEEEVAAPSDPNVKEIVIQDTKNRLPKTTPSSPVEVKQQKASHREEVEKKRQELVAKGTKPETLMTEANLRTWLSSGWSYMKIAKETGVHEAQVANFAKSFGLQSKISKYVAMKKA